MIRIAVAYCIALLIWSGVSYGAPAKGKSAPASSRSAAKRKPAAKRSNVTARNRTKARTRVAQRAVSPQARTAAREELSGWLNAPGILENPAALVPFFEQLHQLESGASQQVVHVLHYGDSHTAADLWPGMTRRLLQARFGNGGPGFTHAGTPWNGYRHLEVKSWSSNAWYSDGLMGRTGDGRYGLSGVSMTANRPGQIVNVRLSTGNWAELHYLQQPGGGRVEISDNGHVIGTLSTAGETAASIYRMVLEPGSHLLEARTLESAPVRLFGWIAEQPRGITYDMMGLNGAQANIGLQWDEETLGEYYRRRPPALIVLAYGTNEARSSKWTKESYHEMFCSLLDRYRRLAPEASILVIGAPDHFYRYRTGMAPHAGIDRIVEAQRDAALSRGAAFWDLRERMGGKGSMRRWVDAGVAQPDHVHFTGDGYRLLGAALYKELMDQFATYVRVRNEAIESTLGSN